MPTSSVDLLITKTATTVNVFMTPLQNTAYPSVWSELPFSMASRIHVKGYEGNLMVEESNRVEGMWTAIESLCLSMNYFQSAKPTVYA